MSEHKLDAREIHWPPGDPSPGDTHTEYGRTWIYIALPAGSPEPGCWKSASAPSGGGDSGGDESRSGFVNLDGGNASSIYISNQVIDGGKA